MADSCIRRIGGQNLHSGRVREVKTDKDNTEKGGGGEERE